jgi:vacuolar protein sorting-associated protein 13A/C
MLITTVDTLDTIISPEFFFALRDFIVVGYNRSRMGGGSARPTPSKRTSTQTIQLQSNDSSSLAPSFTFRINVLGANFYILQDARTKDTDAMVLSINQFVVARESIFSLAVSKLAFHLCSMSDRQNSAIQLIEAFDLISIIDSRSNTKEQSKTIISIDAPQQILIRVSYHDILIVLDIVSTISASALKSSAGAPKAPTLESVQQSFYSVASFHEASSGKKFAKVVEKV